MKHLRQNSPITSHLVLATQLGRVIKKNPDRTEENKTKRSIDAEEYEKQVLNFSTSH